MLGLLNATFRLPSRVLTLDALSSIGASAVDALFIGSWPNETSCEAMPRGRLSSPVSLQAPATSWEPLDPGIHRPPRDAQLEEDCCVICLEPVCERATAQPCQHRNFHWICLAHWLQESEFCPLCKHEIEVVEYGCVSTSSRYVYNVGTAETVQLPESRTPASAQRQEVSARSPAWHQEPTTSPSAQQPPSSVLARTSFPGLRQRGLLPLPPFRPPRPGSRSPRASGRDWPLPDPCTGYQLPLTQWDPQARAPILRRMVVYRCGLYSYHVGTNRVSHYRELSPTRFSQDARLRSRAKAWIRRELQALRHVTVQCPRQLQRVRNSEGFLLNIVEILKFFDLRASDGEAEARLCPFFGVDYTRIFLHELRAWLRSPHKTIESWDRHVQYGVDLDERVRSIFGAWTG